MKVLLINPNSNLVEKSRKLRTFLAPILPLGLASIAAVVENAGFEVKIIDQFASKISSEMLLDEVKRYSPEVIGFSCLTPVMTNVKMLVQKTRNFSNALIVLGNIHATIFAEELLREATADIVVKGEGEITFLELLQQIQKNGSLHGIKGICFGEGGKIIHNQSRPLMDNLDALPYPAWHLFELKYYKEAPMLNIKNDLIFPIGGSRGCPYKCIFCAQDKIYPEPRYRKKSNIIKELEYMNTTFNVRSFVFIDANFPFSTAFGLEFCNDLISSRLQNKVRWVTEIRVDMVNEELLTLMKKAGVYLIMFGFETGNNKILNYSGKTTLLGQAKKVMKLTKALNIYTVGLFILGLPGENKESCQETIDFAKELDCDIVKFNIAVPYPGSKFFDEVYKNKNDCFVEPERFNSFYDWSDGNIEPVFVPQGMTAGELIGLQRKAMFEFYARPKVIIRLLRQADFGKLFYGAYVLISKYFSYLSIRSIRMLRNKLYRIFKK